MKTKNYILYTKYISLNEFVKQKLEVETRGKKINMEYKFNAKKAVFVIKVMIFL